MDLRKALKDDDGFSVVEVLVASIILVLGALAVFMTFSGAIHNVQRGRESQAGITVAQREMEKIRGLPYSAIALKTTPPTSANSAEPNYRVSGETFNVNRTGTASYGALVVSASGSVDASSSAFTVGGVSVTVYRYVVWRKDNAYCATGTNGEKESCKKGQNFKRVIIAVVPQKTGNTPTVRPYYELQSDFVNPAP
jgi:Tfp pilus assembly protein PilV